MRLQLWYVVGRHVVQDIMQMLHSIVPGGCIYFEEVINNKRKESTYALTLPNPKELNAVHILRHDRGCHVHYALNSRNPSPASSGQAVTVSMLDCHDVTCRHPPTPRGHFIAYISCHASSRHAHSLVTVTSHLPPSWHPMRTMAGIRPPGGPISLNGCVLNYVIKTPLSSDGSSFFL